MLGAPRMWNLCAGLCTLGVSASGCFFELADPVSTGGQGGVGATGGEVGNGGGGKGGGSGGGTGDGGGGNGAQGGMATGGGGAGGSVSAYAAEVIADGAIAYYRLNETRGAVAQDAVGSFNAAIVGGVTFGAAGAINGDPDTAFELLAGGLGLGTMQPIDSVTPWTVEAWVHPTALDATASRIFDITDAGPMRTGHTWFIRNDGTAGNIQGGYERWLNGSISCATHSTDQIAVGEYSHLVLTFDGQNARLYYNGVNVVTSNPCPALPNLNGQFFFGRAQNGGSTLDGQFDELAIYDSALSAAQITSHYSYGQR